MAIGIQSFFHMYANQHRKINRIGVIINAEGVNCTSPNAFMDYYKALFLSSSPTSGDDCLVDLEEKVTSDMNDQLALDFT
jgi:hypothetical protein